MAGYKVSYKVLRQQGESMKTVAKMVDDYAERVGRITGKLGTDNMLAEIRSNLQKLRTQLGESRAILNTAGEFLIKSVENYGGAETRQVKKVDAMKAHNRDFYKNPVVVASAGGAVGGAAVAGGAQASASAATVQYAAPSAGTAQAAGPVEAAATEAASVEPASVQSDVPAAAAAEAAAVQASGVGIGASGSAPPAAAVSGAGTPDFANMAAGAGGGAAAAAAILGAAHLNRKMGEPAEFTPPEPEEAFDPAKIPDSPPAAVSRDPEAALQRTLRRTREPERGDGV
jgi:hypothetical protein